MNIIQRAFYVYISTKIPPCNKKGGFNMLSDLVEKAQRGEEAAMLELIQRFTGLFQKVCSEIEL